MNPPDPGIGSPASGIFSCNKDMRVIFEGYRNGCVTSFKAKLEPDAKMIEFNRSDTQ